MSDESAVATELHKTPKAIPDTVIAHSGTHHSYMTALAVQDSGRLRRYFSSFYYKKSNRVLHALGVLSRLERAMARRRCEGLNDELVSIVPQFEALEKLIDRTLRRGQTDNRLVYWRDRQFDRVVSGRLTAKPPAVLIGYPNCALKSFTVTQCVGGKCVMDLPIGHFREAEKIFIEEKERHPEFADTITYSEFDDEYAERVDQEFEIADHILVPSQFVRQTLLDQAIPSEKIVVIPYGSWIDHSEDRIPRKRNAGDPLSVVYFGQITQRKGIKYLLDAIKTMLKENAPVSLTMIGGLYGECQWRSSYEECFRHYEHMPRHEMQAIVSKHDVFVLPTLFEGSAYVIPEALSLGLPVITTPNSGGESIRDGVNG